MASIYKRQRAYWVSYMVGGRNVCRSLGTANAREAEELKRKYEALNANGLLPQPSNTPIGPFLQSLCAFWRQTRGGKSAENDIGRLRRIFGPCCEALKLRSHTPHSFRTRRYEILSAADARSGRYLPVRKLEDLTPEAIARYLERRVVHDGIVGKTANHLRIVLSGVFAYARKYHGYRCPHPDYLNPIQGVERFPEKQPVIKYLSATDIIVQLEALSDQPEIRAMVAVYIYAGLRRSEALWLTPNDVDLEERVIRVRKKEVEKSRWQPKTGIDRVVPIGSKLLAELQVYLPRQHGTWFFTSPDGQRWDPDNFSRYLRDLNKALGHTWNCKEFRHTFGSQLAQKGRSLFKISAMMGNSPEICRKYYAALVPHEMHDDVEF